MNLKNAFALALGATCLTAGLQAGVTLTSGNSYDVTFSTAQLDQLLFAAHPAGTFGSAKAGFYKLSVSDPSSSQTIPELITFCIELDEVISGTNTMTYWGPNQIAGKQSANLSQKQVAALDILFASLYKGPTISDWAAAYGGSIRGAGNYATALQMAVWEVVNESSQTPWDLASGAFAVAATSGRTYYGLDFYSNELVEINAIFGELNSMDDTDFAAYKPNGVGGFLDFGRGDHQDQSFYMPRFPVPEPSVIGLQALVVLGLLFRRRRR